MQLSMCMMLPQIESLLSSTLSAILSRSHQCFMFSKALTSSFFLVAFEGSIQSLQHEQL